MYIYHALINALSTHMIHINLNMIFYTRVKLSPTKTIYIKYYKKIIFKKRTTNTHTHTHTRTHAHNVNDCSRNWVLMLGWKYCEFFLWNISSFANALLKSPAPVTLKLLRHIYRERERDASQSQSRKCVLHASISPLNY